MAALQDTRLDLPGSAMGLRPVFLVQGFATSVRVLRPLEHHLCRQGRKTFCPSPALGLGDIRFAALRLHDAIEEAALATPFERVDLVGHSMGGLVAAYVLKRLDRGRRVSRVIALGTPFCGLELARLAGLLLGPLGCSLGQLTPGSPLLRLLARLPVPRGCTLVSLAGTKDWLVPPAATRLPATPGHSEASAALSDHWDLLLRKRCFAQVVEALERPVPATSARARGPLAAA